jgi:molybdopterin-binding protein
MENLKPKDAAEMIGVSYPTIKQWIYEGKIKSIKTPGGHHRISPDEVERLSGNKPEEARKHQPHSGMAESMSVRNRLTGRITNISYEGLFAEVTMDVGGQKIISIITRRGCEEMRLRVGMEAVAFFKATEVMISRQ